MIEDKTRHCEVQVRFNAHEYQAIAALARSRGTTRAALLRELLLKGMHTQTAKQ